MNIYTQFTVFTKDEIHYCIPIDNVREVIRTHNLILSPIQTYGFIGFIDFRNTLCPVMDIHGILHSRISDNLSAPYNIMVIDYESLLFAILIDKFIESISSQVDDNFLEEIKSPNTDVILINKVYRYKNIALYRLDLNYFKNYILNNIKNNEQKLDNLESLIKSEDLDEIEMICFTIEKFIFGIPITDLIEVIEGYGMQPLFRVNKFLRGLINLRGQIIACVDISEVLGLEPRKMEEKNQFILLQNENSNLALCIDMISKKQKFQRKVVQNVETIFSGELADYLLGIIENGQERIFIISGQKIFESKYLLPNRE